LYPICTPYVSTSTKIPKNPEFPKKNSKKAKKNQKAKKKPKKPKKKLKKRAKICQKSQNLPKSQPYHSIRMYLWYHNLQNQLVLGTTVLPPTSSAD
jgi:hypothetical protein